MTTVQTNTTSRTLALIIDPRHTATLGADFRHPVGTLLLDASTNYYYRPFADPGGEVNWNTRDGRRTVGVSLDVKF
jgi:hypothetical protein